MATDDDRVRRIALNEAAFRAANERLGPMNEAFDGVGVGELPVVCECSDPNCIEQFTIGIGDYRRVRADPVLFVLRPGHVIREAEEVVERHDVYVVVRKRPGEGARVARETAGDFPNERGIDPS